MGSSLTTVAAVALALVMADPGWASAGGAQGDEMPAGWHVGPYQGALGTHASVSIPEGYLFLDQAATATFLEENENPVDGNELGTIIRVISRDDYWFAVFSYFDSGHIDDSDRDAIDADQLLVSLRKGNEAGNVTRRQRGWHELTLDGWFERPFYDLASNNLTWSTKVSSDGSSSVNHSVRLLGRTGYMGAMLVADPARAKVATTEFNDLLRGFAFNQGRRYAEFRSGDKLAGYGLSALIGGAVAAGAVKTGVLQKVWKLLVVALVALVGAVKKFLGALSGRRPPDTPAAARPPAPGGWH